MNSMPAACPICEGALTVREMHCRHCDTTLSGHFSAALLSEFDEAQLPVLRRLAQLSAEQLAFVESFVRCEGKLNRLQEEIGLSYPTLRARLNDILRDLGVTPAAEAPTPTATPNRRQILDDLQAGRISADEAARLLRGEG